jgi:ABC-2 type transport system permease protein
MRSVAQFFIRIFAFVRKEIISILRQPRLVFSLILGPFLILLLFGIGYRETPRTLRTLFVVTEGSPMLPIVDQYATQLGQQINSQGHHQRRGRGGPAAARRRGGPGRGRADRSGEHSAQQRASHLHALSLRDRSLRTAYIEILGRNYTDEINRLVLLTAADQGK